MNNRIRVHVVKYKDCKNLVLRYIDPVTGKYSRSTVYRDPQTGEETETGTNRKEARKLATLWEADLNAGRDQGRGATAWAAFRLRYEKEVVPSLADRTAGKIGTVFNAVERVLPKVASGRLADLTPEALSRFQTELRNGKRAESTIAGYLAHLKAALAWAHDQKMITAVPKIKRPKRAKKGGRNKRSKGRPVTEEEFDRLLVKVPVALAEWNLRKRAAARKTRRNKGQAAHATDTDSIPVEVSPAAVESWRYFLHGLWLSGLRLEESLNLYWNRGDRLHIDLSGKRPRLVIPAELEKGNQDRLLPIVPDFAAFLLATPEAERRGPVFRPLMPSGNRATAEQAGRMVSLIGQLTRVVVHTDPKSGKVKHASAHDLRRSFGNRWAKKVMPAVLMQLMRHESIETTMAFYVDLSADDVAEDLYAADAKGQADRVGTVSGTVAPDEAIVTADHNEKTPCVARG
jgi:integrase